MSLLSSLNSWADRISLLVARPFIGKRETQALFVELDVAMRKVHQALLRVPRGDLENPYALAGSLRLDPLQVLHALNELQKAGKVELLFVVLDDYATPIAEFASRKDMPPYVPNLFGEDVPVSRHNTELAYRRV